MQHITLLYKYPQHKQIHWIYTPYMKQLYCLHFSMFTSFTQTYFHRSPVLFPNFPTLFQVSHTHISHSVNSYAFLHVVPTFLYYNILQPHGRVHWNTCIKSTIKLDQYLFLPTVPRAVESRANMDINSPTGLLSSYPLPPMPVMESLFSPANQRTWQWIHETRIFILHIWVN